MLCTVVEDEGRYDLTYGNSHIIGGVQYEISEEQLKQIQNCQYYEVQTVIRNITLTCRRILNPNL